MHALPNRLIYGPGHKDPVKFHPLQENLGFGHYWRRTPRPKRSVFVSAFLGKPKFTTAMLIAKFCFDANHDGSRVHFVPAKYGPSSGCGPTRRYADNDGR